MSIIGMPVWIICEGMIRREGLKEGPPISIGSAPCRRGRLSIGSPTPLKVRPSRLSLEKSSCTWRPRNSTSSPVEMPLLPAKTCSETSSPFSLITWA